MLTPIPLGIFASIVIDLFRTPGQEFSARTAISGSRSTMRSNAAAGPRGRRLACSQFWSVFTLTPMRSANSDWDSLVRLRMAFTRDVENR